MIKRENFVAFDFADTLGKVRRLNFITRCQRFPLVRVTTVAEHSFHTAVIALFIAEEFAAVDVEQILRRALLHDAEEVLLSDIPHDVKQHLSTDAALRVLAEEHFKHAPLWFREALTAPCNGSQEHNIAKLADLLELAMYCVGELLVGNTQVRDLLRSAVKLAVVLNNSVGSVVALDIIEKCEKYAD